MLSFSRTVIISCAGMGNRLGLGTTKALLDIDRTPLILRHLQYLDEENDVRVVVGYQAQQVIDVVKKYRKDITFVFNHKYRETGTGASVVLAANYANKYILSLDGDLIIHPDDMKMILNCNYEFVGGNPVQSDDPWMLCTYKENTNEFVSSFSKNIGNYEWNGVTQLKSSRINNGEEHVFQLIEPHLPLPFMQLRTREIDTIHDYENAIKWVKSGFKDDIK